jgi:hypothetical protein
MFFHLVLWARRMRGGILGRVGRDTSSEIDSSTCPIVELDTRPPYQTFLSNILHHSCPSMVKRISDEVLVDFNTKATTTPSLSAQRMQGYLATHTSVAAM